MNGMLLFYLFVIALNKDYAYLSLDDFRGVPSGSIMWSNYMALVSLLFSSFYIISFEEIFLARSKPLLFIN